MAELHPPRSLKVPTATRKTTAQTRWHLLSDSCALLAIHTDAKEINAARDSGRLAVRRLAGLIRREIPALLLTDVLWEGAIASTSRGTIKMMLAQPEIENVNPMPEALLHEVGLKLLPIEFTKLPNALGKALEWLALARAAHVRIEKFTHLWLSIVTLVNCEQSRLDQKPRIEAYVATMSDVLRSGQQMDLAKRLKDAYDIRNELWHEARDTRVTPQLLTSLESDAFALIDFEFIKIGKPIPRS
jgi:hypothetical protein